MRVSSVFLAVILASGGSLAFGHGEDKPGPYGGFIRMPGAFHVELVPMGATKAQIYLLDIQFKNPSLKNSAVKLRFKNEKVTEAKCAKKDSAYLCEFPAGIDLSSSGTLLLQATREGQKGVEVSYPTPLKR